MTEINKKILEQFKVKFTINEFVKVFGEDKDFPKEGRDKYLENLRVLFNVKTDNDEITIKRLNGVLRSFPNFFVDTINLFKNPLWENIKKTINLLGTDANNMLKGYGQHNYWLVRRKSDESIIISYFNDRLEITEVQLTLENLADREKEKYVAVAKEYVSEEYATIQMMLSGIKDNKVTSKDLKRVKGFPFPGESLEAIGYVRNLITLNGGSISEDSITKQNFEAIVGYFPDFFGDTVKFFNDPLWEQIKKTIKYNQANANKVLKNEGNLNGSWLIRWNDAHNKLVNSRKDIKTGEIKDRDIHRGDKPNIRYYYADVDPNISSLLELLKNYNDLKKEKVFGDYINVFLEDVKEPIKPAQATQEVKPTQKVPANPPQEVPANPPQEVPINRPRLIRKPHLDIVKPATTKVQGGFIYRRYAVIN